jgi:hypothetical protein
MDLKWLEWPYEPVLYRCSLSHRYPYREPKWGLDSMAFLFAIPSDGGEIGRHRRL